MFYSRTTQYAIRALIYLAGRQNEGYQDVQKMSDHLDLPQHYLAKILQELRNFELLRSSRGRNGGFRLAIPPAEIMLYDVIMHLEEPQQFNACLLAPHPCEFGTACTLICDWNSVKGKVTDFLKHHSIQDLLAIDNFQKN